MYRKGDKYLKTKTGGKFQRDLSASVNLKPFSKVLLGLCYCIVIPTAPELTHGGRDGSCYANLDVSTMNETMGSFHAKSPKIRKISRVTISDFDENWLKCSSTYMMATCKKVLSSGDKFYFYSQHIYRGGSFLFLTHDVEFAIYSVIYNFVSQFLQLVLN